MFVPFFVCLFVFSFFFFFSPIVILNILVFLFVCVHVGREQVSVMVENAISGDSMASLIYQPWGCGEQNMIHMTLPVIATKYLDTTNQWETVGLQKREEALRHMKTGMLTHVFLSTNNRNIQLIPSM